MRQSGGSRSCKCCNSDKSNESKLKELQNLLKRGDCKGLEKFLSDNDYFECNEELQTRVATLIAIDCKSNEKIVPILDIFMEQIQESD